MIYYKIDVNYTHIKSERKTTLWKLIQNSVKQFA